MNNAEKFKQIFGLYATELWAMPEEKFLKWLNAEALDKQIPQKPEMIWDTTFGKIRPHCLVCGASNPTGANYCWNCGQRFISEEES